MPPATKAQPAKKTAPTAPRPDDDDNRPDDDEEIEPDSREQAILLESGARPVNVDVEGLHAQIQRMQAQLDLMNAQQVDTSDPLGAAVLNLATHIQAHCNASAALAERSIELRERIGKLRESDVGSLTADDAAELRIYVDEWAEDNPGVDLSYVRRLARDLHKTTLDKNNKNKGKDDKK